MTTEWADVSHYQTDSAGNPVPIDDSYPYKVFAFRTNSGDKADRIAGENARRALAMLEDGRLAAVFPYYFFRPGQGNCDLHRQILTEAGLWAHPRTASYADVEDANGQVTGDQSAEVNDEIERMRRWYGNPRRVFGYLNAVANANLWRARPENLPFVTPSYSHTPGVWAKTAPPGWMQVAAFAQQYTDRGRCAPWPGPVCLNRSPLALPVLLALLGIDDEQGGTPVPEPITDPVTVGAAQLRPWPDRIRQIRRPENVNPSTRTPAEPWVNDMWSDLWNELVWDGFTLPDVLDEEPDEPRSAVGWILTTAAELRVAVATLGRIESKLDRLLAGER
ncbi:hypothetical protein ACTD5D_00250 [Nocardia takedensis]|uniref:hypothetical protein n=2 Tax=Nocardia takedensis TaxID=259390 RepID=UPI003F771749